MKILDKHLVSKVNRKKALMFIVRRNAKTKSIHLKAQKFSGVKTVVKYNAKTSTTFSYDMKVASGEAKLIVVDNNKQVTTIIKGNGQGSYTLQSGVYRLRLVGTSASVDAEIKLAQ